MSKKRLVERLGIVLDTIFPHAPRRESHKFKGASANDEASVTLDLYYPGLQLAFQAVLPSTRNAESVAKVAAVCKNSGISLVLVPTGWDQLADSLRKMIDEVNASTISSFQAAPAAPPQLTTPAPAPAHASRSL